jgi:hypothetical protein
VVDVLVKNMLEIMDEPESRKFVVGSSGELMPLGPDAMREFQQAEIQRFAKAVRSLSFQRI